MLLRLALLEMFCETACSSVFHVSCTEIANLCAVTLDQDRESQGLVVWLSSRSEARAQTQKQSSHGYSDRWQEYITCCGYHTPPPGAEGLASPDLTHLPSDFSLYSLHTTSDWLVLFATWYLCLSASAHAPHGLEYSCSKLHGSRSLFFPATFFKKPFQIVPRRKPSLPPFYSNTFSVPVLQPLSYSTLILYPVVFVIFYFFQSHSLKNSLRSKTEYH